MILTALQPPSPVSTGEGSAAPQVPSVDEAAQSRTSLCGLAVRRLVSVSTCKDAALVTPAGPGLSSEGRTDHDVTAVTARASVTTVAFLITSDLDRRNCSKSWSVSGCVAVSSRDWYPAGGVWASVTGLGVSVCRCAHAVRHAQANRGTSVPKHPVIVERCGTNSTSILRSHPGQKESAPEGALPNLTTSHDTLRASAPGLAARRAAGLRRVCMYVWRRR